MNSKLLFHITDYRNLSSILKNGGLSSYAKLRSTEVSYKDIAHQNIQERRSTTEIQVPPYGVLHNYVPFYFAPRSPMLYAIANGIVEGFEGNQSDIIYLVANIDKIRESGKRFVFTDGHAIMALTDFYNDLNDLNEIDWPLMEGTYWHDTDQYPDRKRKRQAEFLVYESVPLECILGIGVQTKQMKTTIENLLLEHNIDMKVLERPNFYF